MMRYSASQALIDEVMKHCAVNSISHDQFVYSLLVLLRADMKAFGDKEHNLHNEDGVLLVHVKLIE